MVSFAMFFIAMVLNLVAIQYGQGALRIAVDEGARAGSALGNTTEACQQRANDILRGGNGLLRGSLGDDVTVVCRIEGTQMVAAATGSFRWWFLGLPDVAVDIEGRSVLELAP